MPVARPQPFCEYTCEDGIFNNTGGNPPPGYFCPPSAGACAPDGCVIYEAPFPIESSSRSLAANTGHYVYNPKTKSLYFSGGRCKKGMYFQPIITTKQLAKLDADAAMLVKEMLKNKRIASFGIVLKAQKLKPRSGKLVAT